MRPSRQTSTIQGCQETILSNLCIRQLLARVRRQAIRALASRPTPRLLASELALRSIHTCTVICPSPRASSTTRLRGSSTDVSESIMGKMAWNTRTIRSLSGLNQLSIHCQLATRIRVHVSLVALIDLCDTRTPRHSSPTTVRTITISWRRRM